MKAKWWGRSLTAVLAVVMFMVMMVPVAAEAGEGQAKAGTGTIKGSVRGLVFSLENRCFVQAYSAGTGELIASTEVNAHNYYPTRPARGVLQGEVLPGV